VTNDLKQAKNFANQLATDAAGLSPDNISLSKVAAAIPGLGLTGGNTITLFG
jgi:hypothetical protein